jgi:cell filamentation protein
MKYSADNNDPYLDPDTGILRNLLGIRTQAELDTAESSLSFLRTSQLHGHPVLGRFNLKHLQAIHKRLFGDLYEWAGQLRHVEIAKGTSSFARYLVIESGARQLFQRLAAENCLRGLDPEQFSQRAGYYLGEINVLHPFREGNGRAQREFIRELAQKAGYRIDWSRVNQDDMVRASIEAYNGDPGSMAALIRICMGA